MPVYVFRCDKCGVVDDCVEMSIADYVGEFACGATEDCSGQMKRVFGGIHVSIGQVPGAGWSPSR